MVAHFQSFLLILWLLAHAIIGIFHGVFHV